MAEVRRMLLEADVFSLDKVDMRDLNASAAPEGQHVPPPRLGLEAAAESSRLDTSTASFLGQLRETAIHAQAAEIARVVAKVERLPTYEQLLGLDSTVRAMFPALGP